MKFKLMAVVAGVLLTSGCGHLAPGLQARGAQGPNAMAADPKTSILTQAKAIVAKALPGATITPIADAWREPPHPSEANPNQLLFDLETKLSTTGEAVEFYGLADKNGKLIPGTLEIIADHEATYRALTSGGKRR